MYEWNADQMLFFLNILKKLNVMDIYVFVVTAYI